MTRLFAEDRTDTWSNILQLFLGFIFVPRVIVIEKCDPLSTGGHYSRIASARRTAVALANDCDWVAGGHLGSVITRAIIDDDDLQQVVGLRQGAFDGHVEEGGRIIGWDDSAHQGQVGWAAIDLRKRWPNLRIGDL